MIDTFEEDKKRNIAKLAAAEDLRKESFEWIGRTSRMNYSYHFTWMGRPIIQFPADIVAMQEIIWRTKPDLIIETGIARGGSIVFYASMLELLGNDGIVLGVDIDIREHNRVAIEAHPQAGRIRMIQGSSIEESTFAQVAEYAKNARNVMVVLDSMHTHDHVLKELELYAPLVTKDSYLVVFDTVIEFMPDDMFPDRPWAKGNNPYTAVQEFLKTTDRFELDAEYEGKLLISVAPGGYLKCVK